MNRGSSV